jgi:uncharacterized protein YcfL
MKKFIMLFVASLLITACSISEPRLSFGKKCMVKDDKVVYSYVWVWDKNVGLTATESDCEHIATHKLNRI